MILKESSSVEDEYERERALSELNKWSSSGELLRVGG